MISIKASMLESIRKDPNTYGKLIALGEETKSGGSHGMFACMVEVARAVHLKKLTLRQAIRELHSKFLRFKPNRENELRQARLVEQLVAYLRHCKKLDLKWIDGARRISWGITNEVMLTGLTPWVVADNKGYISYFLAEKTFDWTNQLRFPLYQQYLSENTIECEVDEIRVGIYFADTNTFDIQSFNRRQLKLAIDETGKIFNCLYHEYQKSRR